jgi:signal transduction histidine kinase
VLAVVRSLLADPRPPGARAARGRDWVLLAVLVVLLGVEVAVRQDLPDPWVPALLTLAALPGVLVRRTHPLLALLGALLAGLVPEVLAALGLIERPTTLDTAAFALLLVYSLARWGSGREVALGVGTVLVQVGLTLALGGLTVGDALGGAGVVAAAVAVGVARRVTVRSRDRDLERVRSVERAHLARELHDTVAHRVTAVAIRAQAGLAASAGAGGPAVEALHDIEAEATTALAEMRAVVGSLREDGASPALSPGATLADLRGLAQEGTAPVVEVVVDGEVEELPAAVASAIHRMAQEAVTNARRHARHATRVVVRVATEDGSVRLTVHDDGVPTAAGPRGQGFGLAGMRERADLLGGRCEAGPDPDGGWTVAAVLPRDPRRPLEPAR